MSLEKSLKLGKQTRVSLLSFAFPPAEPFLLVGYPHPLLWCFLCCQISAYLCTLTIVRVQKKHLPREEREARTVCLADILTRQQHPSFTRTVPPEAPYPSASTTNVSVD